MSQTAGRTSRTSFLVTAYRPGDEGILVPDTPTQGPCAGADSRSCDLSFHHNRERKTGPCFALAVLRCRTHRRAFTLYPPGHVPYGRKRIAPVAENGDGIRPERPLRKNSERPELFRGTYFDAALDAGTDSPWQRHSANPTGLWWPTQGRHLKRALSWLGISADQSDQVRIAIAEALDLPTILLREQAERVEALPGYKSRGSAVCRLLWALPRRPCLLDRLALAGHLAGLWGEPLRWDSRAKILRDARGHPVGTERGDPPG